MSGETETHIEQSTLRWYISKGLEAGLNLYEWHRYLEDIFDRSIRFRRVVVLYAIVSEAERYLTYERIAMKNGTGAYLGMSRSHWSAVVVKTTDRIATEAQDIQGDVQ